MALFYYWGHDIAFEFLNIVSLVEINDLEKRRPLAR